jgi:hypothetical protein
MKKTLAILFILSSNLVHSASLSVNVTKNNERPLCQQKKSSACVDKETMNFDIQEEDFLHNMENQKVSVNGWKIFKGLAGLWFGTKCFFIGSKGALVALSFPEHIISQLIESPESLSPMEKLLTNRGLWLTLCGSLTVFSLWVLKKSADNLYQGISNTEDTLEFL